MFCKNCGKPIPEGSNFCPGCGQHVKNEVKNNVFEEAPKIKQEVPGASQDGFKPPEKRNKIPYIVCGAVCGAAVIIVAAVLIISTAAGGGGQKKVIEKLQQFTSVNTEDMGDGEIKYIFDYVDGNWNISVTEANVAVLFWDGEASDFLESIGSEYKGYFAYDLDEKDANIYVNDTDSDGGVISIYTYNIDKDEWLLIKDGDRLELTKDFEDLLRDGGLPEIINTDIENFKSVLEAHELTIEEIADLSYKSVEKNISKNSFQHAQGENKAALETKVAALMTDIKDIMGIRIEEAKALGLNEALELEADGATILANEDDSLILTYEGDNMAAISIKEGCAYPFYGIYMGASLKEAQEKLENEYEFIEGDAEYGSLLLGDEEKNILIWLGNNSLKDTVEEITISFTADIAQLKETSEPAQEALETDNEESIAAETDNGENLLTDPITMGWGGAYRDDETGERLVVAAVGYEWSYCLYSSDGTITSSETYCSSDAGSLEGTYAYFAKNENGFIARTSGIGGMHGSFYRISGSNNPDTKIEGSYGDENTVIRVSNQLAELDMANIPVGADIADVQITYNNGISLSGRLYTQQDGSLGIIDTYTYEVYGIITFTDKTAIVQGSYFDGTYEMLSNE